MAAVGFTPTISDDAREPCVLCRTESGADSARKSTARAGCYQSNGGHREACEFLQTIGSDGR